MTKMYEQLINSVNRNKKYTVNVAEDGSKSVFLKCTADGISVAEHMIEHTLNESGDYPAFKFKGEKFWITSAFEDQYGVPTVKLSQFTPLTDDDFGVWTEEDEHAQVADGDDLPY